MGKAENGVIRRKARDIAAITPAVTSAHRASCTVVRMADGLVLEPEPSDIAGQSCVRAQWPVERMRSRRQITDRQYAAAERLVLSYELGILGGRDPERGIGGAYSPAGMTDAQIAAARDYAEAIAALGCRLSPIVLWVVIGGRTLEVVAQHQGGNRNKLAGVLEIALDTLADHFRIQA